MVEKNSEELLLERDWLFNMCEGLCGTTRAKFYRMWTNCAHSMIRYALYREEPKPSDYPINDYGIECCKDVLTSAPAHLKPSMEFLLKKFKDHLNTLSSS